MDVAPIKENEIHIAMNNLNNLNLILLGVKNTLKVHLNFKTLIYLTNILKDYQKRKTLMLDLP